MAQDFNDPRDSEIDLAETADFSLGQLQVRPAMRSVARGDDQRELQPRVMQVLVALAQARPNVVSRDRLIVRCWHGRIVGDDAINRCILVLRHLARDLGETFEIQNVARVGYRLVAREDARNGAFQKKAWGKAVLAIVAVGLMVGGLLGSQRILSPAPTTRALKGGRNLAEAQRLYLAGRAMLRTGNPQVAGDARVLFKQAVAIDPSYAPGWAGLTEAVRSEASLQGPERVIAVLPEARSNLRRALSLSPRLAAAHGQLGALLGFTSPQAQRHLLNAARLDPSSAEAQLWLATARRASGDFAGEIAAYRRARELDRNWYRPVRDLAIATAEMGHRAEAMKIARSVPAPFPGCAGMPARIAWIYGDIAESARCSAGTAKVASIWAAPARVALASARLTLGLSRDERPAAPIHIVDTRPPQGRIWMASAPAPAVWRLRNRSIDAALAYRMHNLVAAKLMLKEGRHDELVATYDGSTGLLGLAPKAQVQAADLPAVAIVAVALKRAGRAGEAAELLIQATRVVDTVYRLGPAPFSFDAEAAAIAAVRGQHDRAIADLRRARRRGWVNNSWSDLPNLADEPAFASMKRDAGFKALLAELDELYARERRQLIGFGL